MITIKDGIWQDPGSLPVGAIDGTEILDGTITGDDLAALTASRAMVTNSSGKPAAATTTAAEIGYVNGLTSPAQTQLNSKKPFHGIESVGTITFNNTTHELSVSSVTYWHQGSKYTTSSPVVCDLDLTADRDNSSNTLTANKLYYIYFKDITGKLYWSDTPWSFTNNVFICTIYWNGSEGAIQKELHGYTRDLDWHIWAHDTIGTRYESGLTLTNPTTVNDALLQIETGTIHDEDQDFATGQMTSMRGWYQASSGVYTFADYSLPYIGTSGQPKFLRTSDYTLQNVAATDYVVYWVYVSLDKDKPLYVFPTQAAAAHNTIALARNETAPSLTGIPFNGELKLIYKFIYKGDGNFQESVDYRSSSPVPGGGTSTTTAGSTSFVPTGDISATSVQQAIEELDTEKVALANLSKLTEKVIGFSTTEGSLTYNTNSPVNILDFIIPANSLTPGSIVTFDCYLRIDNQSGSSQTLTLALKYDDTTIGTATTGSLANSTNLSEVYIQGYIKAGANTSSQYGSFVMSIGGRSLVYDCNGTSSEDATGALHMYLTLTLGAAHSSYGYQTNGHIVRLLSA